MEKLICESCGREVPIQDYTDYNLCIDCYIEEDVSELEKETNENCR